MITNGWKMTAVYVALAVWFTYSVPARAAAPANSGKVLLVENVLQTDDDDDGLSGGALAVLLLAVGGAVAGVLYASFHNNDIENSLSLKVTAGNTAKVSMDGTDASGKKRSRVWTASLDKASGMITLTMNGTDSGGRSARSHWRGKVDGRYYAVSDDPTAEEFSLTKVNARTLAFSAKKAGRVTLTGRIIVSGNGRSVTINKDRINRLGRRLNKQTVYSTR